MLHDDGFIVLKKTPPFSCVRLHENDRPAFSKNSTLGTVFVSLPFWAPKTSLTRGLKVETENKVFVFKNIRICVDGGLNNI